MRTHNCTPHGCSDGIVRMTAIAGEWQEVKSVRIGWYTGLSEEGGAWGTRSGISDQLNGTGESFYTFLPVRGVNVAA